MCIRDLLFLVFILVISGCRGAKPPPSVTVEELRAHPETYNGQLIRVHGIGYSGFEFSHLRPLGSKITVREETNESIWLEFDLNALEKNSPGEYRRMSEAKVNVEKAKDGIPFFDLDAEGIFRHAPQTKGTAKTLFSGFGHLNGYSSEFRVTRLRSSNYLGGIRLKFLPVERKPLVWQEYLFTNLSHSQTVLLSKKPEQENPFAFELTAEGEISGTAEIQLLVDGKPFKQEHLSGKFKVTFQEDWFSPQMEVRYFASEKNVGTLKMSYAFIRREPIPFEEIFVPPD